MDYLSNQCSVNIDRAKVADCLTRVRALINARLTGRFAPIQSYNSIQSSSNPEMTDAMRKFNRTDILRFISTSTSAFAAPKSCS
jgi:hypothetical protein